MRPKQRTYIDSNILIAAFKGKGAKYDQALTILDDPEREFVISDFLRLETISKPTFNNLLDEVDFMTTFFERATENVCASQLLTEKALEIACKHDLHPVDALHISAAIIAQVDEFITLEKSTKPMFRVGELRVNSLHDTL